MPLKEPVPVEAFAADRANQTLYEWGLPGAPGCDEDFFETHVVHMAAELATGVFGRVSSKASATRM